MSIKQRENDIKNRQEYNQNIVNRIAMAVKNNPNLRFGQILALLDISTIGFYEESVVTLMRIQGTLGDNKRK